MGVNQAGVYLSALCIKAGHNVSAITGRILGQHKSSHDYHDIRAIADERRMYMLRSTIAELLCCCQEAFVSHCPNICDESVQMPAANKVQIVAFTSGSKNGPLQIMQAIDVLRNILKVLDMPHLRSCMQPERMIMVYTAGA